MDTVSCRVEGGQADVLLAIDGSGSVTAHEFAMARSLLERLVGCLVVGPEGARVGLLQVAGRPVLELALGDGTSQEGITRALHDMRQLLGDTNSGQALAYAAGQAWAMEAGGRPRATRLLIWVTDGYSSDRLEGASHLLREARVLTFVVTTGRRDQGLSLVASSPSRDFLFFTETEELPGLADRLCCTIRDLTSPPGLRVSGVTAESFTLSWRRMTIRESERYKLAYVVEDRARGGHHRSFELPWDARTHRVRGLQANTTYKVTLRVRGRETTRLQTRVTTLAGETGPSRIAVRAVSPYILDLDWTPSPQYVQYYRILFGPLTGGPVRALGVNGSENGVLLPGLRPNTSYLINVSVLFLSGRGTSISVSGRTLP
ncbi:von Willebrand factor A domain-containing protein 1-like, partial [Mustelus asterias]